LSALDSPDGEEPRRGDETVRREHEISDTLYYQWRDKLYEGGIAALAGKEERGAEKALRKKVRVSPYRPQRVAISHQLVVRAGVARSDPFAIARQRLLHCMADVSLVSFPSRARCVRNARAAAQAKRRRP